MMGAEGGGSDGDAGVATEGIDDNGFDDGEGASVGHFAHDLFDLGEVLLCMAADLLGCASAHVLLDAPVVGTAVEFARLDEA